MALAPYFDKNALAARGVLGGIGRDQFVEKLEAETVAVVFGKEAAEGREGRILAELVVNLLARFYPKMVIRCDSPDGDLLKARLLVLARDINPRIDLSADTGVRFTRAIVVGSDAVGAAPTEVFAGSEGWIARTSRRHALSVGNSANPFGAMAAACFAVAAVFREVFSAELGHTGVDQDLALSVAELAAGETFGNAPDPAGVELLPSVLIGAGATGQAALWALSRVPGLRATIEIVDPEVIELSNVQRYLLTGIAEIGQSKVELAKKAGEGKGREAGDRAELVIGSHEKTWGAYLSGLPYPWPRHQLLLALDSAEDRIEVQGALPAKVYNCWTQAGDLGVSVHDGFGTGACVACMYLPSGKVPSLDEQVAEAIRLPNELMLVRELLHSGGPVGSELIGRIALAIGCPVAEIEAYSNGPLIALYSGAICGGALLQFGAAPATEVPMAFQSAFAGCLLAAAAVGDAMGIQVCPTSSKAVFDLLRPLPARFIVPLAKHPSGLCICQDQDYIAQFQARP